MGGFFGVTSKTDCVADLFYGTDYHSHLGTQRGGLAVTNGRGIQRVIHDIRNAQFRSKFDADIDGLSGRWGIGVISDYEDQPLLIGSHLGVYAIVTVGMVRNLDELAQEAFGKRTTHFSEMSGGAINPTELVATLINQEANFTDGIRRAQQMIEGSCSIMLLTDKGIYAARDRYGRTPIILGRKDGAYAATFESCALPNLDYQKLRELGPGEVVRMTPDGVETMAPPLDQLKICAFLWIYYGYPASTYESQNVEDVRNRCGASLARRETGTFDLVAGIPDSGVAHGLGFAAAIGLPYRRPFVKYTPTWPRSFMPQNQHMRELVARMKLLPIQEIIAGKRLLFCEDSVVRGTQLKDTVRRLFDTGAREIHLRPACPPLMFACPYLNFSRTKSEFDLIARRAIRELEGHDGDPPEEYLDHDTAAYARMIAKIGEMLGVTTVRYMRMDDMAESIGLPRDQLCTHCWNLKG